MATQSLPPVPYNTPFMGTDGLVGFQWGIWFRQLAALVTGSSGSSSGGGYSTITTSTEASTSIGTYFCNATLTLTLPAPGGGYRVCTKNNGSGTVTVAPASGNIENQASATLNPGDVFTWQDDGTNYWQVA